MMYHWRNGLSVHQWSGRLEFNPWSSYTKPSKNRTWCFLTKQYFKVCIKGKWSNSRNVWTLATLEGRKPSRAVKQLPFSPRSKFFCWILTWKPLLTCCVNCVGDQQEIYLFPKVNRTLIPRQKCHVNCLGGMHEGSDAGSRKTTGSTSVS